MDAVLYAVFEYRRVCHFPLKHPEVSTPLKTLDFFISSFFFFYRAAQGEHFCLPLSFCEGLLYNWHWYFSYFFMIKSRRQEGLHVSFSNRNSAWLTHTELVNMTFVMFPCYAHNRPRLVGARGGHWDAVCPCSVRQHPRLYLSLSALSQTHPIPHTSSHFCCVRGDNVCDSHHFIPTMYLTDTHTVFVLIALVYLFEFIHYNAWMH